MPTASLRWRDYLVLFVLASTVVLVVAALQPVPGYMDADYYYAEGKQLSSGHGFYDLFLWNYLDHPQGLPHPSNSYWYPLASIVAAGGMVLTGKINFISARIGFGLVAVLAPIVIAALAYRVTQRRMLAIIAGLLAIFSGYYLPFMITTDNYGLYFLLGALYFLYFDHLNVPKTILLGLLAGLMNLARGDGLLWLPLTLFATGILAYRQASQNTIRKKILSAIALCMLAFLGYLVVMGPWFIRNLFVFGTIMPPGSGYVFWMTSYNQLYSFTPESFTFQSWLAGGLMEILNVRASALWQNLGTAFFAQGMIFLVPFIIAGVWNNRHLFFVQFGLFGWLVLLLVESILFPFASVQGGFYHAGAAFQPLWFIMAPIGLNGIIAGLVKKNKQALWTTALFPSILVMIMACFSFLLVKMRVVDSGWNEGETLYLKTEQILKQQAASSDAIVMVRNPPAYFIMTGRRSIVVPYGDVETLLSAARKYHATYVILEQIGKNSPLDDLFEHPDRYPQFSSLGDLGDNHVLFIKDSS